MDWTPQNRISEEIIEIILNAAPYKKRDNKEYIQQSMSSTQIPISFVIKLLYKVLKGPGHPDIYFNYLELLNNIIDSIILRYQDTGSCLFQNDMLLYKHNGG